MKRRFAVCFTVVCVFMLLSIGALHAKKKAPAEKPKIVFWQNEAGSGLSGWYKAVIEVLDRAPREERIVSAGERARS